MLEVMEWISWDLSGSPVMGKEVNLFQPASEFLPMVDEIPSSTRASTSLEAAVNQYGSDTIASSPCQPYGASYGTNPVTDRNSRVLQKNVATHLEKTSVNKENALPKRANDKLSCSSLPTQATKSTTPKSLNSKLVSSITAIRNSKRDSEGNKVSHLHAAKKTLEASSLKVSRFVSPKAALTIIDHTTRVEKIGPSSPPMKRKMNEVTGEPLIQRKDDTAAVLKSRLEAFHKQTAPPPFLVDEEDGDSVWIDRGIMGLD